MTRTKVRTIEDLRKDGEPFLVELLEGSEQSCALVGAAALDRKLQDALLTALPHKPKKLADELFVGAGKPLSTLSAKINLAAALGIIPPASAANLHKIRRVRNFFAHTDAPLSFDAASIAPICQSLVLERNQDEKRPRVRFALALLDATLLLNAADLERLRREKRTMVRQRRAMVEENDFVTSVFDRLRDRLPIPETEMIRFRSALSKHGLNYDF